MDLLLLLLLFCERIMAMRKFIVPLMEITSYKKINWFTVGHLFEFGVTFNENPG